MWVAYYDEVHVGLNMVYVHISEDIHKALQLRSDENLLKC